MPTNVTYEFSAARVKFENAATDEERLIALQEMLSKAPSHKGGENLRKDISRKISALKSKMEKKAILASKRGGHSINIKKDGAGQVVIIGYPNSGKSTFLANYTNAKPDIAPYPYTTTKPEVGMLDFGGAQIQLVEIPYFFESSDSKSQILSLVRASDAIIFLIKEDELDKLKLLINTLELEDIYITKPKPKIEFVKSNFAGISFVNENNLLIPKLRAIDLLKNFGFRSHTIILNQKINVEDLVLAVNPRATYKRAIIVINNFTKEFDLDKFNSLNTTTINLQIILMQDKDQVRFSIFEMLDKIIVYTKKPGEKASFEEPLVLERGSTIIDAAKSIHKILSKSIKSAKVWGSAKYPGLQVSKNYVLQNKDIVEFIM
ncbi:MAG: GTPase [archaeon]